MKQMKLRKKGIALLIATAMLLCLMVFPLADAGDFSGDSDYGGSWDSGSDWGSSSDWDSDSDWDDDSSHYYYYGGSDGSSGGGGGMSLSSVLVVVAVVVIVILIRTRQAKKNGTAAKNGAVQPGPEATKEDGSYLTYKKQHSDFDESAFVQMLSNRYVQMQNAWTDKNWEPMRGVMSDALYTQFERQLEALKRNEYTNYVERIAVLSVRPIVWKQDEKNDNLIVELKTRIVDYTVKDADGSLVSGSKTAEKFMTYEWTLTRSKDFAQGEDGKAETGHFCPNCGAPLDVNESTKCSYCGQTITVSSHDSVVTNIRGIQQRTQG